MTRCSPLRHQVVEKWFILLDHKILGHHWVIHLGSSSFSSDSTLLAFWTVYLQSFGQSEIRTVHFHPSRPTRLVLLDLSDFVLRIVHLLISGPPTFADRHFWPSTLSLSNRPLWLMTVHFRFDPKLPHQNQILRSIHFHILTRGLVKVKRASIEIFW